MQARQDPKYAIPLAHRFEVRRDQLLTRVEANGDKRLLLVVAPAGFGKSTLVAQIARSTSRVVAWVNLTSDESEALVLGRSVAKALSTALPDLRLAQWEQAVSLDAGVERLANSLASDLNLLEENIVIVLETLEHLSDESGRWLMAFLTRLGEGHGVIVTHWGGDIALDFSRFIARGDALIITQEDLVFSAEEATALLRQAGSQLDAQGVWEAVKGWPAAIGMVLHGAPLAASPKDLVRGILRKLPERTRTALPEAAVLGIWSPQAVHALGLTLPDSWLFDVIQVGLPLKALQGSGYEPHQVVKDTLEEQLQERPERHRELHSRAAKVAESKGDLLTAVAHYRIAEQYAEARQLLDDLLPRYHRRSEWMLVHKILEPFPIRELSGYGATLLGIALVETGFPDEGEGILSELARSESAVGMTFFGLALVAYRRSDLLQAEEFTEEGLRRASGQREVTELLRMKSAVLAMQLRYDEALSIATDCVSRAERQGEPGLLAHALSVQQFCLAWLGRNEEALRLGRRAIDLAMERDVPKKAMSAVDTYAATLWKMGRAHEALPILDQMLRNSKYDYPLAEPFMLRQRGDAYAQMGHDEQATEQFQRASDRFRKFKIVVEGALAGLKRASCFLRQSRIAEAEAAVANALLLVDRDDPLVRIEVNLAEGALHFIKGDLTAARTAFGLALRFAKNERDPYACVVAAGYLAEISRQEGVLERRDVDALLWWLDALGYDWPLRFHANHWRGLYLACAERRWSVERWQPHLSIAQPQPLPSSKMTLTLKTFGAFEATTQGNRLELSSKPQEVLTYLALSGRTRIDEIADALWPNASLRAAKQTLAQHVRHLRERFAQALPISFNPLPAESGTYGLSEEITVVTDVATLIAVAKEGSLERMVSAVRSYQGPFLVHSDSHWVLDSRRHYEQLAASLAVAAARKAKQDSPELAIEMYERAIEIDAFFLEAYRELADLLEAQNKLAGALVIRRRGQEIENRLAS